MLGIWAIILAAGESKRMGSPKMMLPYGKVTIIGKVIENVLASDVEKAVVVLGCYKDKILEVINNQPVMHCYNADYKSGMLSSVKRGFAYLPGDFCAALVFPGDQPMIEAEVINLVTKAYKESGRGIIVPVYKGKRGHPLLVDKKYREEIMTLDETEGLRGLAFKHPDDLLEIKTDNPLILRDIDTIEDYIYERNLTKETWKKQSNSN